MSDAAVDVMVLMAGLSFCGAFGWVLIGCRDLDRLERWWLAFASAVMAAGLWMLIGCLVYLAGEAL